MVGKGVKLNDVIFLISSSSTHVAKFGCWYSNVLPEAICCCLQTCFVDVMLLWMDCVCILINFHCCRSLGCLVTYTNSSLLTMYGLRLFCNVKLKVKG